MSTATLITDPEVLRMRAVGRWFGLLAFYDPQYESFLEVLAEHHHKRGHTTYADELTDAFYRQRSRMFGIDSMIDYGWWLTECRYTSRSEETDEQQLAAAHWL